MVCAEISFALFETGDDNTEGTLMVWVTYLIQFWLALAHFSLCGVQICSLIKTIMFLEAQ